MPTEQLKYIRDLGRMLDDLETPRVANGNRIGAYQREHAEAPPHYLAMQEGLAHVEHIAELALLKAWRKHPLAPWAKSIPGLGEKSVARLIAVIGDPSLRAVGHWEGEGLARTWTIDGYEPRLVSQLWAYCGHGDPARRKAAGMGQEELFKMGNPDAKKRVYLVAEACMKGKGTGGQTRSPFRDVYDARREVTADRVHEKACVRCGPSGHPAPPGSPWSDGHKHADALRIVGKEILRALWIEDCRLQCPAETHSSVEAA